MKTFKQYLNEEITRDEFKRIEEYADRLFKEFDIDIEFTKHFKDRANDERNHPDITPEELVDFFKKAFEKFAPAISKMEDGKTALLTDIHSKLNLPFVIKWNGKGMDVDLVAKTIMRTPRFMSRDRNMRF